MTEPDDTVDEGVDDRGPVFTGTWEEIELAGSEEKLNLDLFFKDPRITMTRGFQELLLMSPPLSQVRPTMLRRQATDRDAYTSDIRGVITLPLTLNLGHVAQIIENHWTEEDPLPENIDTIFFSGHCVCSIRADPEDEPGKVTLDALHLPSVVREDDEPGVTPWREGSVVIAFGTSS